MEAVAELPEPGISQAAHDLKEEAKAKVESRARESEVPWSKKQLPGIDVTLQMARLSNIVYDENPVLTIKKARQEADIKRYEKRLVDEGGKGLEMWFYECAAEGTEAAVTFSPENERCTVIFRGTETNSCLDIMTDLNLFKKHLAPDGKPDPDNPGNCFVHAGFRGQYYGKVTSQRSKKDAAAAAKVAAATEEAEVEKVEGPDVDKILETALFDKVSVP